MPASQARPAPAAPPRDLGKVVVCGGLGYRNETRLRAVLDAEHRRHPIRVLVHGGAEGADSLAAQWAREAGITEQHFPADWAGDGPRANSRRDQHMADSGAGRCIVFPGGPGTADMAWRAEQAGMQVIVGDA